MKRIKLFDREFVLTPEGCVLKISGNPYAFAVDTDGYAQTTISVAGKRVTLKQHRLVWLYWHGEIPEGMTIDHIDGNKLNNSPDNLQVMSRGDNARKGNAKHWQVIEPNGAILQVYNLYDYCKARGLKHGAMTLVAQGKHKQHKGYQVYAV